MRGINNTGASLPGIFSNWFLDVDVKPTRADHPINGWMPSDLSSCVANLPFPGCTATTSVHTSTDSEQEALDHTPKSLLFILVLKHRSDAISQSHQELRPCLQALARRIEKKSRPPQSFRLWAWRSNPLQSKGCTVLYFKNDSFISF
jgi:hypothetical protein